MISLLVLLMKGVQCVPERNISVLTPNFIVITVTHNWHGLSGGSKTGGNIRGSCLLLAFRDYNPAAAAGLEPGCMYQLIWCRGHEYQYIFISTKMASMCLQDHKMHWTRFSFLRIAMRAWNSLNSNSNPSLVLTLADYHQPHFNPIPWFAQCRATLQCCIDRWGYKPSVWNSKPGIGIWDGYNQGWTKSPKNAKMSGREF